MRPHLDTTQGLSVRSRETFPRFPGQRLGCSLLVESALLCPLASACAEVGGRRGNVSEQGVISPETILPCPEPRRGSRLEPLIGSRGAAWAWCLFLQVVTS